MGDMVNFRCAAPGCGWQYGEAYLGAGMAGTGETLFLCRHCQKLISVPGVPIEVLFGQSEEVDKPTRCDSCQREVEPWGEDEYDDEANEVDGSANLICPKCGTNPVEVEWFGIWD